MSSINTPLTSAPHVVASAASLGGANDGDGEGGMDSALTSLLRAVRGFAEGSLVVLGFAVAILLIGTPLALFVQALHKGLSWLVR